MSTISQLRFALICILLAASSLTAYAQTERDRLTPSEGFWVVESSPKSRQCTVRFYTNEKKLIYEETVNRALKLTRRQTKQQLNIALERAMFVWNATHQIPTDRQWVAAQFDRK
ncbi:hypothetical protein [Spirosoma areae]